MELQVTNKRLDTNPIRNLITQGEALVDRPQIVLPKTYMGLDISGYSYEMRAASDKDTLVRQPLEKALEGDNIILTWTVTKEVTAIPCNLYLTVVGMDETGEEVIKITSDAIHIRQDPDGNYNPPPANLLEDALRQMQQLQAAATAASTSAAESAQTASAAATTAAEKSDSAQTAATQAAASAAAAAESAQQASQMATFSKGWYADPESLRAAYPTGENGWNANVGTTDTIWTWDSDTGAWVDTNKKTELSEYPTWSDLTGKLLVPCNCIYADGTHDITYQSAAQEIGARYTVVMVPTHDYTAGDTVTIAGETVQVEYQASDAVVQSGAWLAGRPVQAEVYGSTLYLAANQPSQGDGDGNVTMAGGAEITVPEGWGNGPWTLELTEGDEGSSSIGPNVAGYVGEIVYFADSLLRPNHVWADGGAIDTQQWPELAEHAAAVGWAQNETGQYLTPDLRGRFLLGASDSHTIGETGGEETHTLTVQEMPRHNHGMNHSEDVTSSFGYAEVGVTTNTVGPIFSYGYGMVSNRTDLNAFTALTGGSQPHNNMPPYYTVTPQIRAKVDVVYAKTPESIQASDVTYDNTTSGLQADKVQGAVDEVAERTEGLINIDDVVLTPNSGWNLDQSPKVCKVVNGVLSIGLRYRCTDPQTFNGTLNYPVNGFGSLRVVGVEDVLRLVAVENGHIPTIGNGTVAVFEMTTYWDPTWTKKEGT